MFVLFTNIAKKLFLPAIEAASASEKADHSRNGQTVEIVLTDRALQDGRQDTRIKKDNKMKIDIMSDIEDAVIVESPVVAQSGNAIPPGENSLPQPITGTTDKQVENAVSEELGSAVENAAPRTQDPDGIAAAGAKAEALQPLGDTEAKAMVESTGETAGEESNTERPTDCSKARAAGKRVRKKTATRSRTSSEGETGEAPAWNTPVPFATHSLPGLDCAKLPPVLGNFCQGLAEELQMPRESVLANALAVVATCAQSTYSVDLYGNIQPTNLFIMSPMRSASRKRAALKACIAPITAWEAAKARELEPRLLRENIEKRITKRAIRKLNRNAEQAQIEKDENALEAFVTQICELEARLKVTTVVPRLVTDTLARLEETVHQQNDTLSLASADDNCLDILSSASSRSAKDLMLRAWDASPYTVDKKGKYYCMRPRLTMTLAPRTSALEDPKKVRLLQSRGLDTRFIYLMPHNDVRALARGRRMPGETAKAFFEKVLRLLPASWNEPGEAVTLTLSSDAELMWLDYQDKAERRCQGIDAPMQEWTIRFASDVVGRIAALFHLLSCADPKNDRTISSEQMAQDLTLGDLLFEHAKAAFRLMRQDTPEETARKVLGLVTRKSWSVFSARVCYQLLKGQPPFRTMKPLKEALETLIERGYIRTVSAKGKNGRAMKRYELNPAVVIKQEEAQATAALDRGGITAPVGTGETPRPMAEDTPVSERKGTNGSGHASGAGSVEDSGSAQFIEEATLEDGSAGTSYEHTEIGGGASATADAEKGAIPKVCAQGLSDKI